MRDQIIRNLLIRMKKIEKKVNELDGTEEPGPETSESEKEVPQAIQVPLDSPTGEGSAEAPSLSDEEKKEQEQLVRAAFERTLIERGGLLLPPYRMEFEPSVGFIHSSSDRIVIDGFTIENTVTIGDIFAERIRRDSWFFSSTFRMGLPWDTQFEVTVPYTLQSRDVLTADSKETTDRESGLGDTQVSLSHQFVRSKGWVPDILGSLRWKTKTGSDPFRPGAQDELSLGSGFHSLQGTATAVKVSDPAVFLSVLSFTQTFGESKSIGKVKPGNTFGVQLGMAFALNLDTSINFGFDGFRTERTKLNDVKVPGSSLTTATFSFGISHVISNNVSMDFSLGVGLTRDSPDFQVNFSFPIRYSFDMKKGSLTF